ncbi:MAG: hypothetical protein R3C59_00305 [Planctomycetaceae bacterium]
MNLFRSAPCALILLLLFSSGCGETVDPQVQAWRTKFLLTSVPTDETSISKVLKSLTPDESDSAKTDVDESDEAESNPGGGSASEGAAVDANAGEANVEGKTADVERSDQVDVVIKGRIHAGDASPWADGMAAFVLTDATGHDGESDHDPHTCPFCSRRINDYLAKVSFLNDAGELIEIDSRKLFDVTDRQLVYVTGTGRIDDDGLLNVTATGLYLPK